MTWLGSNERRWARVVRVPRPDGSFAAITNAYTELATSMNTWSATAQKWIPARDEIEIVNGAAISRQAQHKIVFSPTANDANGTLIVVLPIQQRLRAHCAGLAYTDRTGRSVFFAEPIDAQG